MQAEELPALLQAPPARRRLGTSLQPHVKPIPKHIGNMAAAVQMESKEKISGQHKLPWDAQTTAPL